MIIILTCHANIKFCSRINIVVDFKGELLTAAVRKLTFKNGHAQKEIWLMGQLRHINEYGTLTNISMKQKIKSSLLPFCTVHHPPC
jgi:hypothetical protein